MQFPNKNEPISTLIALGRYAAARVLANQDVKALAALILEPQKRLQEAVAAYDGVMVDLINSEAVRDSQVDEMNDLIMDLGRQALARFSGRENPEFRRLFPVAPSDMTHTPVRDRMQVYGKLVAAVTDPETPVELRSVAKKLDATWKLLLAGEKDVQVAEGRVERAGREVAAARDEWVVGYRRLHAQLTDKYPKSKAVVERFFRKLKAAKRATPSAPIIHDLIPIPPEAQAAMGDEPAKK